MAGLIVLGSSPSPGPEMKRSQSKEALELAMSTFGNQKEIEKMQEV